MTEHEHAQVLPEVFRQTTASLATLVQNKVVRVLVGPGGFRVRQPPFTVRFDIPAAHAEVARVAEERVGEIPAFVSASRDIADVLSAVVADVSEETFAEARQAEHSPWRDEPGVAVQKYRLVSQAFDVEPLKVRAWVKRTSKHDVPLSVSWEVAVKQADSTGNRPSDAPVPYGVLRVASSPPQHDIFFALARHGYREITLTLDREDVLSMRSQLDELYEALAPSEGTGQGESDE